MTTKANSKNFLSKQCLIVRKPTTISKTSQNPRKSSNTGITTYSHRQSLSSSNKFTMLLPPTNSSQRKQDICRKLLIRCWMPRISLTIFISTLQIEAVTIWSRCAWEPRSTSGTQIPRKYVRCLTLLRGTSRTIFSILQLLSGFRLGTVWLLGCLMGRCSYGILISRCR